MTGGTPSGTTPSPLLIVLSGPSGAGKDAVIVRMKQAAVPFYHVTTMTTRPRRPGEEDGADYHFISKKEFDALVASGGLLEHADVYGNWYGVPREPARAALKRGEDVIIKVDIQGAATIRKLVPEALLIFLAPPSAEELTARLRERQTENRMDLERRLETAAREMAAAGDFDFVVYNPGGDIKRAVEEIRDIIAEEKRRKNARKAAL